jgi:hypothetical protein
MPVPAAQHAVSAACQLVPAFLTAGFNRICLAQQHNTDSPSAPRRLACPHVNLTVAHTPPRSAPAELAGERARLLRLATPPQSRPLLRTALLTAPCRSTAATRRPLSTCSARQSRHPCQVAFLTRLPCPVALAALLACLQTALRCLRSQLLTSQKRNGGPATALP